MPEIYALAFGAHPDDVELSAGATLLKIISENKQVAVCDLSEGELGTRGSREIRRQEATKAAQLMGYTARVNLNLGDGNIADTQENRLKVIQIIRQFRPTSVFTCSPLERHPDHEHTARLIKEACFYAGLANIPTEHEGDLQTPHRPTYLFYYLQQVHIVPDLIVDVSETFERARQGVLAFESQFYRPGSNEPETHISRKEFLTGLEARARYFGELIGVKYGEPFVKENHIGIPHFSDVFK
ncbi:LmbE family protein [Chloroherpeton thalassium ATCC 35110]|uniref:LmbE family protein n=1 Tax=Chloroherpeton thalassium (strain ATCC 35110 / GB-78) TaxID=517418 RepID=B3QUY2_CHLT3|nr:bacillithiol biosynthesis deacetylase BshB1 [Chloroherpeton thalassium]ACF14483.1 LmbE family protein [Chloroherpeton thalassium ATCC 35110]